MNTLILKNAHSPGAIVMPTAAVRDLHGTKRPKVVAASAALRAGGFG